MGIIIIVAVIGMTFAGINGADPCSLDTPRHGYRVKEKKGIKAQEVTP
jgi:hypothetical protein